MKEKVAEIIQPLMITKTSIPRYMREESLVYATQIHNLYMARFKEVVGKLTVIDDEGIYKLNGAETEERKRIFREAGFLDGSRANMEEQLQDCQKQLLDLMEENR